MATTPSAFYQKYLSGNELTAIIQGLGDFDNHEINAQAGEEVRGTAGNDIIEIGLGDTLVGGGGGFDVVITNQDFTFGKGIESVVLTGREDLTVTGSGKADRVVGNTGDNAIDAKGGDDIIAAGRGNDSVTGGSGNDTIFGGIGNDSLVGGSGDDSIEGGAGSDSITGSSGDDLLKGMAGHDQLFGGADDDRLLGGDGNDTLVGGTGRDILTGGEGRDVFVIQGGDDGIDQIRDFERGDTIDLSGTGTTSFQDLAFSSDGHGNTIITLEDGTKFKLMGIDPADIRKGWFEF